MFYMEKYWFINIVAMDKNGYIGKDNKLPWKIRSEMIEFLRSVRNYNVVMGRKTCESLPKLLNDKKHFVLTSDKTFHREGFTNVYSIEELLSQLEKDKPTYVVGGSSIYELFINLAEEREDIRLTNEVSIIDISIDGDVKFPIDRLSVNYNSDLLSTNRDKETGIVWHKHLFYKI